MALGCVQSIGCGPASVVRDVDRNGHAQLQWAAIASLVKVPIVDVDEEIRLERAMRDGATEPRVGISLSALLIVELVAFVAVTAWRCRHEEIAMRGQGNPSVCR
jgi:hypothetical protein